MSVGRRDYTWGFLNESATEGRYTESFVQFMQGSALTLTWGTLFSYSIPTGYRLSINRINVAAAGPMNNALLVKESTTNRIMAYFTGSYDCVISEKNPLYFAAGKSLIVQVYNFDEITVNYFGSVIGALESIT